MAKIKFDSESLNRYFVEKTGKTEFTLEDLQQIWHIDIYETSLTQHDLDIIIQAKTPVNFTGVNLSGKEFKMYEAEMVWFRNCQLRNIRFTNCVIKYIMSWDFAIDDDFIEQLKTIKGLRNVSLEPTAMENIMNLMDLPEIEGITLTQNFITKEIFQKFQESEQIKYISMNGIYAVKVPDKEKIRIDIENSFPFERLISDGILPQMNGCDVEVKVEDFEQLSEDAVKEILNAKNIIIRAKNMKALEKILETTGSNPDLRYTVEEDCEFYSSEEVNRILNIIKYIVDSIPEDASEFQKFMQVYKIIGLIADYDETGCPDNEFWSIENRNRTKSLRGVLCEGTAVCQGYALALYNVLNYMGIETRMVSGYGYDDSRFEGHMWNQVKLDGIWYNVDLTWDYEDMREGKPLRYCLRCDDFFDEGHSVTDETEECWGDYPRELIEEYMRENRTELDEYQERFGKGYCYLIGIQDYKQNANRMINPLTIEGMKGSVRTITPSLQEAIDWGQK